VFDSTIYQKVNFFRLGMNELNKQGKSKHFEELLSVSRELSNLLGDKSIGNFSHNYSNLWSILPESNEKNGVLTSITESLTLVLKNIMAKVSRIIKSKEDA